jgi:hypothetical protein
VCKQSDDKNSRLALQQCVSPCSISYPGINIFHAALVLIPASWQTASRSTFAVIYAHGCETVDVEVLVFKHVPIWTQCELRNALAVSSDWIQTNYNRQLNIYLCGLKQSKRIWVLKIDFDIWIVKVIENVKWQHVNMKNWNFNMSRRAWTMLKHDSEKYRIVRSSPAIWFQARQKLTPESKTKRVIQNTCLLVFEFLKVSLIQALFGQVIFRSSNSCK